MAWEIMLAYELNQILWPFLPLRRELVWPNYEWGYRQVYCTPFIFLLAGSPAGDVSLGGWSLAFAGFVLKVASGTELIWPSLRLLFSKCAPERLLLLWQLTACCCCFSCLPAPRVRQNILTPVFRPLLAEGNVRNFPGKNWDGMADHSSLSQK